MKTATEPILVVDLDDTLLSTDLLWEAITELARRKPLLLFAVPFVALGGRVRFKRWLSRRIEPSWELLPINEGVLSFVREARASGRTVVLATAAAAPWANKIAERLGCFDHIMGTTTSNLSGRTKLDLIRRTFDGASFDYIGDRSVDIPLWRAAERAYIVGEPSRYTRRIGKPFAGSFHRPIATLRDWLTALRIEQWSKNLLVLVPVALAHRLGDRTAVGSALVAGLLLSIVASALYVLNDVIDVPRDRAHPQKRKRPIASGTISLQSAWIAIAVGLTVGLGIAAVVLPASVFLLLGVYAVGSAAYSLVLKQQPLLDVLVLAVLYTLRIAIGGVASHVELSPWLLGFGMVVFTSLALLKRHSELVHRRQCDAAIAQHRPYSESDELLLLALGISSAMTAVVVLILYLTSDRVRMLYSHPDALWVIMPLMLWWLMRMWHASLHGKLEGDPLSTALRDPVSIAIGVVMAAIVFVIAR